MSGHHRSHRHRSHSKSPERWAMPAHIPTLLTPTQTHAVIEYQCVLFVHRSSKKSHKKSRRGNEWLYCFLFGLCLSFFCFTIGDIIWKYWMSDEVLFFIFKIFLKITLISDSCFRWRTSGWCCKDLRVDQCVTLNLQHVAQIRVTITDSLSDSWKRLKKEFWTLSLHPTQNYRFRCCVFVHLRGSRGHTTVIKDIVGLRPNLKLQN